jgi:hypothetical protein
VQVDLEDFKKSYNTHKAYVEQTLQKLLEGKREGSAEEHTLGKDTFN